MSETLRGTMEPLATEKRPDLLALPGQTSNAPYVDVRTETIKDGSELATNGVYSTSGQTAGTLAGHSGTLGGVNPLFSLIYPCE